MEREAAVLPLDVYIDTTAMQRATTVQGHLVEKDILSTRIGPGYSILVLTADDSLPCM